MFKNSLRDGIDLRVFKKYNDDDDFLLFIAFRQYFTCHCAVSAPFDHDFQPIKLEDSRKLLSRM